MFYKVFLLFVFLAFNFIYAQNTNDSLIVEEATNVSTNVSESTNVSIISYESYVDTLKTILPDLKINAVQVTNARNNLLSAKGSGDINLSASVGAVGGIGDLSLDGVDSPDIGGNGFQTEVGIGSTIPYSGTSWSVTLSQDALFDVPISAGIDGVNAFSPALTLQVNQPLLKNFFGVLSRYPIKDAEYALSVSEYQKEINDLSVITRYRKMYYEWILYQKISDYTEKIISEAKIFEEETRRRLVNGLVDNDAYQNARIQTATYENTLNENINNLRNIEANIGYFIPIENLSPDFEAWDTFLETATNLRNIRAVPFSQSLQGQVAHIEKIRAEYKLEVMKNNTWPDLELVGQVGLGDTNTRGYFTSFSTMTNVNYFVGFSFNYPIQNREAKAQLEDARSSLYSVIAEYDNANLDYNTRLASILNSFTTLRFSYDNQLYQIDALESRLQTQLSKINQGRLELDDYISTRIDLAQAQISYINLEYQLISAILDYRELLALD